MTLVYLYAVAPAGTARWLADHEVHGIAGARVRPIAERDLVGAVSDVPADEFDQAPLDRNVVDPDWLAPHAAAHQEVNAALLESAGALLPLAFGTIFRADERVGRLLRDRAADLVPALAAVAGRAEWVCTLDRDRRAASAHLQRTRASGEPAAPAGALGRAYLLRQKAAVESVEDLRRLDREARGAFAEALGRVSDEVTDEPLIEGGPAARCTVLLRREAEPALASELAAFGGTWTERGYTARADGPWPPYRYAARVGSLAGA